MSAVGPRAGRVLTTPAPHTPAQCPSSPAQAAMADEDNKVSTVANTGLTQIELGACVGAWVAIFTLFSFIDLSGACRSTTPRPRGRVVDLRRAHAWQRMRW